MTSYVVKLVRSRANVEYIYTTDHDTAVRHYRRADGDVFDGTLKAVRLYEIPGNLDQDRAIAAVQAGDAIQLEPTSSFAWVSAGLASIFGLSGNK